MELLNEILTQKEAPEGTRKCFIESNTIPGTLDEIKSKHLIPSYSNSELLISQASFIETTLDAVSQFYNQETVCNPEIRMSHPILGRVPEARHKPLQYLEEKDKTIYYDRMMFCVEVPSISDNIDGSPLSLTIGGVQAYHLNSLHTRKAGDEHFKLFIGFKNLVCANLKVWSDGLISDLKVNSLGQLRASINTMLENYNAGYQLHALRKLADFSLTEKQFATFIGRCRMYPNLPISQKRELPKMMLGDTQVGLVVKDYYKDESFCKGENGDINLWKLYNLFTNANKSSYIDSHLQKEVNAYDMAEGLRHALESKTQSWFLN